MNQFSYLSEKILDAQFLNDPCRHLEINNFLGEEHLDIILNDEQIHFKECNDTRDVINQLHKLDYSVQQFPGCCSDINDYLNRLKNDDWPNEYKGNPVESYGITFRLMRYRNEFIKELIRYLNGNEFKSAMETKFELKKDTDIITAIQKNLTKYEISPHPDIKDKAMTSLLNINKDDSVEKYDVHTYLLKFKEEYKHTLEFWKTNKNLDRCWVPWSWCEKIKTISKNNTIVIFPPSNDTLHAVKLDYDHTKFQRTQIYGNLMYRDKSNFKKISYKDII